MWFINQKQNEKNEYRNTANQVIQLMTHLGATLFTSIVIISSKLCNSRHDLSKICTLFT